MKSLLLHKLRSVLTMLGIIFGVCSVIGMLAVGEGANLAKVGDLRPADMVHDQSPGEAERDHGGDAGARAD